MPIISQNYCGIYQGRLIPLGLVVHGFAVCNHDVSNSLSVPSSSTIVLAHSSYDIMGRYNANDSDS